METKKQHRADIESLRVPLVFLGAFIIGSIVTMSFAYKEPLYLVKNNQGLQMKDNIPIEFIVEEKIIENDVPIVQPVDIPQPIIEPTEHSKTKDNVDEDEELIVKVDPIIIVEPIVEKPVAPIVIYPDLEAEFPGGLVAMKKFMGEETKYPEYSQTVGDQGKVFVEFVVNTDGSIEQIKVIRGVSKELDAEAMRVVRKMPKWKPAQVNGENVRTRCRIPFNFGFRN
ncbi:MAG: TonB family protein [Brumimicrobium sp.]|nr:TonB family protein [Brumimicrobium sp.]